ncbi:MAG TPA: hypothetical protein VE998_06385 [Terriglobales bacterium]|nr:hypothetical protein [Terriglobales bacterium]
MSTTAAKQKLQNGHERGVALLAIQEAKKAHPHVGLRPMRLQRKGPKSEGFRVPPTTPMSKGFDQAMSQAAEAFPDDDLWEVIGCDTIDPMDGSFYTPDVYGSFGTYDYEPDGFSAGGGDLPQPAGADGRD